MKNILLLTLVLFASSLAYAEPVTNCLILSDKNGGGKFETVLGKFDVVRLPDGSEEGEKVVNAFDAGFQNYARQTTSVKMRIEKGADESFYTVEAWGMTRNRSAEATTTLRVRTLSLSLDLKIATSESETKSAQIATAQQMLGVVRLTCKKAK